MFWCVSFYLGAFGIVWLRYNTQCKKGQTGPKVRAQSHIGFFHNKRTRSTPLDSKLMFWCVLCYLEAFRTVWLPYKFRSKTGRSGAKVRAMKSCRNFSQQMHPIHPIGPLPHVSVRFVLFGCIWECLLRYNTQFKTGQTGAKVRATESCLKFSHQTHPIVPVWT